MKLGGIDEVSYLQWVLFGAPGVFCQCSSLGLISAVSMLPCMGGRTAEHVGFVGLSHVGSQPFFFTWFFSLISLDFDCACTTASSCTRSSHSHHFDYSATVLCVSVLLVFGPSLVGSLSLTCATIFHTKLASATSCSCFRFSYLVDR